MSVVTIVDGQSVSLREGFAGRKAVPVPALKGRELGNGCSGAWWTGRRASKGWESDREKARAAWDLEQGASRRRTQRALLRVVVAFVFQARAMPHGETRKPSNFFSRRYLSLVGP